MKLNGQDRAEEKGKEQVVDRTLNEEDQIHLMGNEGAAEEAGSLFSRPRDKDYRSFTDLLNEHGVPYAIDSGVLLGLMRDGKLLDHEKDIDLQMWAEDEEHLLRFLPAAWDQGYSVTIWLYRGLVCQYRFLKEDKLPVHIMLFRRAGSWAWCPAGEGIGPSFPRRVTRRFYRYFVVFRKKLRERLIATEVTRWPWKVRRQTGTWWVPARFFEQRKYHPLYEAYIPAEWDAYLTYRYGSWRIPAAKWNIWTDDGGLRQARPEEMVDLSRYQAWNGAPVLKGTRVKANTKLRGNR